MTNGHGVTLFGCLFYPLERAIIRHLGQDEGAKHLASLTDEDVKYIIKSAQQGDMQAFEILVTIYEKKAYAVARSLAGNDTDAQDVVQDIFLKLFQNLKSFHWDSSFNTWFYRLMRNAAIDFIRKRKRKETTSLDAPIPALENENPQEIEDRSPTPEDFLTKRELSDLVAKSMQSLPEEQRMILVMRDMMDSSYEEIAEKLQCPLGTVKSRIYRARAALKESILSQREQYSGYMRLKE